jgi:hypothetical protein
MPEVDEPSAEAAEPSGEAPHARPVFVLGAG